MSNPQQSWYKSPAVIGLIITLVGMGGFTLLFKWLGDRAMGQ